MEARERERVRHAQGLEEGLATALEILNGLAAVMIEREREASGKKKANHARRVRIKAYEVAARRIETKLKHQRRLLTKLETPEDAERQAETIRAALKALAL
ncbi:MAG TPA: hypothetical protein VE891_05295 [Allosphingosinicella sp.]|nr:hypothetical protein [Allosphingosinicella sp.]